MIDRATRDRIIDAAKIEEVVADFISLKRSGVNLKGLCPFHDDTTPSFMVSPAKNICHCFACGKGGTPVTFVREHLQLSYDDALRYLAKKYNIEVKEREMTDEERRAQSMRESMNIVNDWALKWFRTQLHDTMEGRTIGLAYFRERGFRDDIIEKFQLGFCPDKRDALWQASQHEGFNGDVVLATGLSIKHDNGGVSDRFRGRVIFPIHKDSGQVVGFGGRVLAAATKGVAVKYQNSPESEVYSKKRELYGLYFAKKAIQKVDMCYLVEGYTDVMGMHQSGVENVVASSGTALTEEQIRLIHRFTENIVVIYDGDAAGIKASQRGIDMLLQQGMNVKLLLLPDEEDPDSFARKHSAQEFQEYLASHQVDFIRFKTTLLQEEAKGDPIKMSKLVDNIVQSIAVIPNEITRTFYIKETAQTLNMDEHVVTRAVGKAWKAMKNSNENNARTEQNTVPEPTPEHIEGQELVPSSPNPQPSDTDSATYSAPSLSQALVLKAERQLVQMIVRYAERIMGQVTNDDGTTSDFSVIDYVQYDLEHDHLTLRNALHQRIFDEAVAHAHEQGFCSATYFSNHPDEDIASLSLQLAIDTEELSKMYQKDETLVAEEDRLAEIMPRLVADYKLAIVETMLKDIQHKMTTADATTQQELMQQFINMKQVQKALSKRCGDRVYR